MEDRSFLWVATTKVSGGEGKLRWDIVCQSATLGGLGILNVENIPRALRLRWPWLEWTDPSRAWVGFGTPCDAEDMDLFYKCTTIIVGDVMKTKFWHAPWLNGAKPKDIAPLNF